MKKIILKIVNIVFILNALQWIIIAGLIPFGPGSDILIKVVALINEAYHLDPGLNPQPSPSLGFTVWVCISLIIFCIGMIQTLHKLRPKLKLN